MLAVGPKAYDLATQVWAHTPHSKQEALVVDTCMTHAAYSR